MQSARTSFIFGTMTGTICSFLAGTNCTEWISGTSSRNMPKPMPISPSRLFRWGGARPAHWASCRLTPTAASPVSLRSRVSAPCFSRPRFLPGSKINGAQIDHAVISDGCILNRAVIRHSIVGVRSLVGPGTVLNRAIVLGSDYYESYESITEHEKAGKPRIGIGASCRIENTIVDKNARIGNNVTISPVGKPENLDHADYYVRDGIVIIPKNGIIPHGKVI